MKIILLNIDALSTNNLMIALVGYVIVFTALLTLYFVFQNLPKLLEWQTRVRLKRKGQLHDSKEKHINIEGAANAAISIALHLYMNEMHDEEQTVLTIKKVSKTYSPWSSKIYGMRWPLK